MEKRLALAGYLPVALFISFVTIVVGFYSFYSSYFIPAIHDEMSYLFQARTFLLGRVVNPVHPERLFFDAYHIINEGIFASKYFPGFALTLTPFELFKMPFLNPIFFYGLQLVLVFLLAKEMFDFKTAYLSVVLTAFSPQIVIQSCFLLSHLPCACFLLAFLYGFMKWQKTERIFWIIFGGIFWAAAFLTRPTTAVGVAFPIAFLTLWRFLKIRKKQYLFQIGIWMLMVALAIILYGAYNKAVTGSFKKSPFDLYAEIHAPFHRYGFNTWNRYRDQANGPRVDQAWNEYYHNHTFLDGLVIAGARLELFIEWLFPGLFLGLFFILSWLFHLRDKDPRHWLIFFIFVSLQVVYVPHWYPGMLAFGSNYLYEASALVLMAIADMLIQTVGTVRSGRRRNFLILASVCWVISSAMFLNNAGLLVQNGRALKRHLHALIQTEKMDKGVIFVRYSKNHRLYWDLIDNFPNLDSPVIFALDRGEENPKLRKYYPEHAFYLFDETSLTLNRLPA